MHPPGDGGASIIERSFLDDHQHHHRRGPSRHARRSSAGRADAVWCVPARRSDGEATARLLSAEGASGELREGLDADVVLNALYGPIHHRLLVPYDDAPLSDEFIDRVVDHVFGGLEWSTAGGGGDHPARR
jgi:tetracycline repressor-like protein